MSPRPLLFFTALLLTMEPAPALDLKGLLKDPEKLKKGLDTIKDAGTALKGIAGIGPEEEKVIGDAVALEIVGKYGGLVRDDDILLRINLVGRSLARYSDRPELNWRFAVLNSDAINAFSAPDGYVFITRGLYDLADTDDTLAAILGHEIAHITGKHALAIVARNDAVGALTKQVVQRSGQTRELEGQLQQFNASINQAANFVMEKGFDPATEYSADLTGRQLAVTTGYAPGGLRAVLLRLQATTAGPQQPFSTHPPLTERLKRLPADSTPAVTPAKAIAEETDSAKDAPPDMDDDDRAFAEAAEKKPATKKKP